MGKSIEEISKMNLADIDRDPESGKEGGSGLQPGEGQQGTNGVSGATAWNEQEKMADPTGEHYAFDATIEKKELKDFVRHHMLHTPAVLGIIAMGLLLPIYSYFLQRDKMQLAIVFFVVLCIVYPIWQYRKIVEQNLKNPIYKNVFHYMVDEKGFHLEAGLRAIDVDWKEFTKLRELKSAYILYTGKKNAYIFPKKDMGASEERIISFIRHRTGL